MALSPNLAMWLRSQGHDATHASELSLDRAADTQILSTAVDLDRIVITADLDFPRLLAALGARRTGLIFCGLATTANPRVWNAFAAC